MLTQNSSHRENIVNNAVSAPPSKEQAQFESLRALYQNALNASAQTSRPMPQHKPKETFSTFIDKNDAQKKHGQGTAPTITQPNRVQHDQETLSIFDSQEIETIRTMRSPKRDEFEASIYNDTQGKKQPIRGMQESSPMAASMPHPQTTQTPEQTLIQDTQNEEELDYLLREELSLDLPPYPESWLVRLFSRPKLVMGIMGMCMLASSVYAGLGYWWLVSTTNVSNAAEPVNMMQIQESAPKSGTLNNINTLQAQPPIVIPKETESKEETLLALATAPAKVAVLPETKQTVVKEREPDLTGRPDPFAPLIQANSPIPSDKDAPPQPKKDVLEDLQYTGFVGNINAKNKLAIIKVVDSTTGSTQTLIKKIGASFYVAGEKVILKGISKSSLQLYVAGENRRLTLSPYQAVTSAATAPTASGSTSAAAPTTGNTAASPAGAPASTGSTSGAFGNLGALSSGNSPNPTNPQLMEPGR